MRLTGVHTDSHPSVLLTVIHRITSDRIGSHWVPSGHIGSHRVTLGRIGSHRVYIGYIVSSVHWAENQESLDHRPSVSIPSHPIGFKI